MSCRPRDCCVHRWRHMCVDDCLRDRHPTPRPCALVVTNGVNRVSWMCDGKPFPLSRTETVDIVGPDFGGGC